MIKLSCDILFNRLKSANLILIRTSASTDHLCLQRPRRSCATGSSISSETLVLIVREFVLKVLTSICGRGRAVHSVHVYYKQYFTQTFIVLTHERLPHKEFYLWQTMTLLRKSLRSFIHDHISLYWVRSYNPNVMMEGKERVERVVSKCR